MLIEDLAEIPGNTYPAGRRTQNLVGGSSSIQAEGFCLGYVTLEPGGGQIPWHNHSQEEVYVILQGRGEMCLGEERQAVSAGQAIYIPSGVYHQLTNQADAPLVFLYCYAPAGEVEHWRQELEGTLPRAGVDAPPLPPGACPQHTNSRDKPND